MRLALLPLLAAGLLAGAAAQDAAVQADDALAAAVAQAAAAAAALATNGTLQDPHVYEHEKGWFDQRGGQTGGAYGPDEDVWFRISPCPGEGECQVLLWFKTFAMPTVRSPIQNSGLARRAHSMSCLLYTSDAADE